MRQLRNIFVLPGLLVLAVIALVALATGNDRLERWARRQVTKL